MDKKKIIMIVVAALFVLCFIICGIVLAKYAYVEYKKDQVAAILEEKKQITETLETLPPETMPPAEAAPETQETITTVNGIDFIADDTLLYINIDKMPIYSAPSESSDVIGYKYANDVINQIGISDYWSMVVTNGKQGFCAGEYLGETFVFNEAIYQETIEKKSVGRLVVPSLGVNVGLFTADSKGTEEPYGVRIQAVVDDWDSAAYLEDLEGVYGMTRLADHNYQCFDKLRGAVENETEAYIHYGTSQVNLVCTKIFNGYNIFEDLTDLEGNSIRGQNDGGFCMYTCNRDGTIFLTYWKVVS